ncbi:MAG: ferredoxin [Pyrinomonadaceae bacterium]|nr:ferredoxin [Pyrinomonadaceae bacterium]
MSKRIRHKLNVDGDFYVEDQMCICCDAAPSEAPDLLKYDENIHCYFHKQPETEEEILQAINACLVSETCAVRYAENNPEILKRMDKTCCDIYD